MAEPPGKRRRACLTKAMTTSVPNYRLTGTCMHVGRWSVILPSSVVKPDHETLITGYVKTTHGSVLFSAVLQY